MIFWIAAGVLAVVVVALLLRPLLAAKAGGAARRSHDLTVYRDQLEEVDRDRDRGLLSEEEAAAARLEIERRILALGPAEATETADPAATGSGLGRASAAGLALLIPAASIALYLGLGSPGSEGLPFASRPAIDTQDTAEGEMSSFLAQLKQRLIAQPDDLEAWILLGQMERRLGHNEAARNAFRQALALDPEAQGARTALAETLIALADGRVERDARLLFAEVLRQDPDNPSARYYGGLAMVQDGQGAAALQVWSSLLGDSPSTAPWVPMLERQITQLAHSLGEDPAAILEEAADRRPSAPGPSAADVAAAQEMSAEEREAFIRSMVTQLADRLAATPDDLEGWLRLARSYGVLGDQEEARQALSKARDLVAALPAESPERQAVRALAEQLGLAP